MSRMEATRGEAPRRPLSRRKELVTRIIVGVIALAVVVVCLTVRFWAPANEAAAQAPASNRSEASVQGDRTPQRVASLKDPASAVSAAAKAARVRPPKDLKVAAVVNGQQITREALANEALRRFGEETLQGLVNKYLIHQACRQHGIQVTAEDIDAEIEAIAEKFGLSTDRWLALLAQERDIDVTQYRSEIVWPTVALRRLAADRLTVTPDEFRKAWEADYGPKVQVRMISVTDEKKAQQLHAAAVSSSGEFDKLAKEHSEDRGSAAARGMIPPIRRHVGDPAIETAVYALEPGEISPIVKAAGQFFIFKCEKHIPATYIDPMYRKTAEERLKERIRDRKLRESAADVFEQLQQEAKLVNVYNNPELQQKMPGVAATINGQSISIEALAEECLARHGVNVLEGEVNRLLLLQELQQAGATVTSADIDTEIARAADAYGYVERDGSPDIDAWLNTVTEDEGATVDLYVRDIVWPTAALKKIVGDKVAITTEDLQKGFEANYGARVEVRAIVLNDHRQAYKVFEMARNNPSEEFFGQLASQYSVEPVSKSNRGLVPPIRRHGGQPEVEKAAFALAPGELSEVIVSGPHAIILKCIGRTQPLVTDIADVRDELTKDLKEKKLRLLMADRFEAIQKNARIENFLAGTRQ